MLKKNITLMSCLFMIFACSGNESKTNTTDKTEQNIPKAQDEANIGDVLAMVNGIAMAPMIIKK